MSGHGGHGYVPITPKQQITLDLVKAHPGATLSELKAFADKHTGENLYGMLSTLWIKRLITRDQINRKKFRYYPA